MSSVSYQQRKQKSVFQLASSARRRVKGVKWCCLRLAAGGWGGGVTVGPF